MQRDSNTVKVGLTVLAALAALAAFIFAIGEQSALFTPTNSYRTMFPNAAGLVEGNPVQLNGVTVGKVDRILLSEDPNSELLEVRISVERRYASRLRRDSLARLKTLGLLGDKYVEITSGSPEAVLLNPGDEIPAALPTDVDELIASGADVVDHAVATARSLSNILARMERGEGLLGELVAVQEDKRITDTVIRTLESVERVADQVEAGDGVLGRLLTDREMGDRIASSIDRLDETLTLLREGDGLAPALLHDAELRTRFETTLADTEVAAADLRGIAADPPGGRRTAAPAPERRGTRRFADRRDGGAPRAAELDPGTDRGRRRHGGTPDQRSRDLRGARRPRGRHQRVEAASVAGPQPPEGGHREAVPGGAERDGGCRRRGTGRDRCCRRRGRCVGRSAVTVADRGRGSRRA